MKKIALSLVLVSALVAGSDYKYELTPVIGGAVPEGNMDLDNAVNYGLRLQLNDFDFNGIKPEIAYDRVDNSNYRNTTQDTDINRIALNGIYEFDYSEKFTSYVLAGLGHESFSNERSNNDDSGFANYGMGIKYPLGKALNFRAEVKHLMEFDHGDNNLLYTIGLGFLFGDKAQPEAPAEPTPITPGDSDNDGVIDGTDLCPTTPAGAAVDADGCCLDSDKDGVKDYMDACPDTPAGMQVDAKGCPLTIELKVLFDYDSSAIRANEVNEIDAFAKFLNENSAYTTVIGGHTDSIGSDEYNLKLSTARAKNVADKIIEAGVDAKRVSHIGYGESVPVADNATAEGRQENRRIEAKLVY